jgi:Domain of unknown function (DUF1707)
MTGEPIELSWKGTPMTCGGSGLWPSGRTRSSDPNLRVSDEDRNKVAEALSQHYSEGRLDANELKERLDQAIGAKTRGDLSGLMNDLPPLQTTVPEPHRHRRHVAVWAALIVLISAVAFPWPALHWFWMPRLSWLVFGVLCLFLFSRIRRRRAYRDQHSY